MLSILFALLLPTILASSSKDVLFLQVGDTVSVLHPDWSSEVIKLPQGTGKPTTILQVPDGRILIGFESEPHFMFFDPSTNYSVVAQGSPLPGLIPASLVLLPDGNVFVASSDSYAYVLDVTGRFPLDSSCIVADTSRFQSWLPVPRSPVLILETPARGLIAVSNVVNGSIENQVYLLPVSQTNNKQKSAMMDPQLFYSVREPVQVLLAIRTPIMGSNVGILTTAGREYRVSLLQKQSVWLAEEPILDAAQAPDGTIIFRFANSLQFMDETFKLLHRVSAPPPPARLYPSQQMTFAFDNTCLCLAGKSSVWCVDLKVLNKKVVVVVPHDADDSSIRFVYGTTLRDYSFVLHGEDLWLGYPGAIVDFVSRLLSTVKSFSPSSSSSSSSSSYSSSCLDLSLRNYRSINSNLQQSFQLYWSLGGDRAQSWQWADIESLLEEQLYPSLTSFIDAATRRECGIAWNVFESNKFKWDELKALPKFQENVVSLFHALSDAQKSGPEQAAKLLGVVVNRIINLN